MERDVLEVDVLVIGAGAAGLACAIRLADAVQEAGRETSILVLEKGAEVGNHILSGAVMDLRALDELIPDHAERGFPGGVPVARDEMRFLTAGGRAWKAPITPPGLRNHGHRIVSMYQVTRWLSGQAEERGVDVYPGFAGAELLVEDGAVCGVRTADMGRGSDGRPKDTFEPGMDVRAQVTVLAEGPRGSLTKRLISDLSLDDGCNPQIYATGVKEVWQTPAKDMEGRVIHTLGAPLTGLVVGGGFIYGQEDGRISLGLVTGLDYEDAGFDPHAAFSAFKAHPFVEGILEGGSMLRYGAKTIPEGGWYAMPRMSGAGFCIVGDGAGLVNMMRLKGVHLAMKSGALAGETVFRALDVDDASADVMSGYEDALRSSWAGREMKSVRNFRQALSLGTWAGPAVAGLHGVTGGFLPWWRMRTAAGHTHMARASGSKVPAAPGREGLVFDKLTDVYHSGTVHEEDQPCHLVVTEPDLCANRCTEEFGNPCQHFCPANVYEWGQEGAAGLTINAANCVHCKTCDIADPYQIIQWTVPEGGGGPVYIDM